MNRSKPFFLVLIFLFTMSAPAQKGEELQAPNVVKISEKLVTAGQPTEAVLASLSKQGFQAVVYLAPSTVPDAVSKEPEIIRGQGIEFVNIPVVFSNPTEADFKAFTEAMNRFRGRRVLVHCQVNRRASAMTFLYRVIEMKEDPSKAYKDVEKIWTPKDHWKEFLNTQLAKAGISFRVK